MKFAAIASTLTLLASTDAAPCNVTTLEPLLFSPDTTTCATSSGYQVTSMTTPTDAQMKTMCENPACKSILSHLQSLAPTDCELGAFSLYKDLINPIKKLCDGSSSNHSVGSTNSTKGSPITSSPINLTMNNLTDANVGAIEATNSTVGSIETTNSTVEPADTTDSTESQSNESTTTPAPAKPSTSTTSSASIAAISTASVLAVVFAAIF